MNDILPCSDCCHEMKTTDKEFFIPYGYRLHQPKKEGTTGAFARTCPLSQGGTIVALECINHHLVVLQRQLNAFIKLGGTTVALEYIKKQKEAL